MSPIRPENLGRYPSDWREIRRRILERADNRCECAGECGAHDGYCGQKNHTAQQKTGGTWLDCFMTVLTISHLDHTPENCGDDNLKAMCQPCHLRYDAPRKRADRIRRQAEGTEPLFEVSA